MTITLHDSSWLQFIQIECLNLWDETFRPQTFTIVSIPRAFMKNEYGHLYKLQWFYSGKLLLSNSINFLMNLTSP